MSKPNPIEKDTTVKPTPAPRRGVVSVNTAAGVVALSPKRVSDMRGKIASKVTQHLEIADRVVKGEVEWTPTQARVFATLINKVIPDLTASFNQHEHHHKNITEMSRDELERIASGVDDIAEGELLDERKTNGK